DFSFPRLREITGFFLLYRVAGLTSLRNLFPNLAVIRGTKLFHNYGFVIYEMMALEEVSLPSLTHVLRGSVRISRNPHLCYVNTIDWDLIASSGIGGHMIKQNKESNECPEQCANCPTRRGKSLCWNQDQCQKVCDRKCGNLSCSSPDKCCSDECLGGCSGSGSSKCFVCSGVKYLNKCSQTCPPSTFKYAGRRCITDSECHNLPREVWDGHSLLDVRWKTFRDECLPECPPGYMEDENNVHECKSCVGDCPKVCNGITVDSVATAQMLRGCTRISGSLEIQISGGENIVRELEENLNLIEEVDHFVKIVRSRPLISLHFFKKLRKINGTRKENSDYSLLVYDNINLQELFDNNTSHKLEVISGKIFFHLNPKLCLGKIKQLSKNLGLSDLDERDVSFKTNGDRTSCDVSKMRAKIESVTNKSALIYWENVQKNFSDHRSLLGYVVSYKEAPHMNVSVFDGRDACSIDTWKEYDVPASDNINTKREGHIISNLKPFTQYVVYIRTYTTVGADNFGAESDLIYFKTLADRPSIPVDLKAVSYDPFEMTLSWLPPVRPNGDVAYYEIKGSLEKEQTYFDSRDYCKQHFVVSPQHDRKHSAAVNRTVEDHETGLCETSKQKIDLENAAKEAEFENQFEDSIHNHVYMKNEKYMNNDNDIEEDYRRRKRNVVDNQFPELTNATIFHVRSNSTGKSIKSLRHFSLYVVEVSACHEHWEKLCSSQAIISVRTAPLLVNETRGTVRVKWDEPREPNGVVVAFELEYKRTNIENFKPVSECITRRQYRVDRGYNLTNLSPGSYSLRLRATSLAGYSNWTLPVSFVIPDPDDGWSPVVLAAIATSAVVVFILLVAGSLWIVFKRKYKDINKSILYASVNPEYINTGEVYVPDEWEVAREKITILQELGQGSFGMVYSGLADNIVKGQGRVKCAIKTVNENATVRERIEFLNEASVMKAFTSHHVLKLMGVVSKGQPTLVVMELMGKGDLKAYLRSLRPCVNVSVSVSESESESDGQIVNQPPTLNNILRMASEIADGMAYLAAKKFVHRDLAARNCMVAEDLTVKIGDFGMTRDIYETDYYRKGGKGLLPVRWMAPESLKDGVFTSLSDAWSYGIVLWEMATLASQPYQGLSNEQVLKYVIDGGVMERPEACPNKLYDLMRGCWSQMPKLRPTFVDLVTQLLPYTRPTFVDESFYFSEEAERI
uniref:Tyrosine-protein kinase receptor n=1 Tax=Strigamia maritima TaxID=126957 RepID=T1JFU0_STRMM